METKTRRRILEMAEKNNLKVLEMKTGTHIKILVQRKDGSTTTIIEAISASDHRVEMNRKRDWRHAALGIGRFKPIDRK